MAKETAKLTGKGLKLAGKGIKKAGTKAIDSYKDNKEDKVHEYIAELKERYPGCLIFVAYEVSLFNMDKLNSMGANVSAIDFDKNIQFNDNCLGLFINYYAIIWELLMPLK